MTEALPAVIAAAVVETELAEQAMLSAPAALSFEPSYHGHGSFVARWYLTPPVASDMVGTVQKVEATTLRVSHWGAPHKAYMATLARTTYSVGPEASSELSNPMKWVRIAQKPAGRYGKKGHEQFLREVLAQLAAGKLPGTLPLFSTATSPT